MSCHFWPITFSNHLAPPPRFLIFGLSVAQPTPPPPLLFGIEEWRSSFLVNELFRNNFQGFYQKSKNNFCVIRNTLCWSHLTFPYAKMILFEIRHPNSEYQCIKFQLNPPVLATSCRFVWVCMTFGYHQHERVNKNSI